MVMTIRPERWFYFFLFLHVLIWTLTPILLRYSLPMDALEGSIWGHQLEWGYDKNPFLNGWLTHLALFLDRSSGLMTYLFCQLSVAACFWAVWQLGKEILTPLYALLGVLLLETIQYYNLHAMDFNDNTLELSLWALTTLFYYQSLKTSRLRDWLLTGIFAGFSMMTKYYTVMLLVPMMLFAIINPVARKQFKNINMYLSVLVFFIIITPHTIWLFHHDFITLHYAVDRVSSPASWLNHIISPLQFIWQQLEVIMPTLLIFSALLIASKQTFSTHRIFSSSFDNVFLYTMGLGPLMLTAAVSCLFGMKLRAGWGQPLWFLSGVMLISWFPPRISPQRFYSFVALLFSLTGVMVVVYSICIIMAKSPSSANFPGQIIANRLTAEWQRTYHKPLAYVAGPRWLAGNIFLYSKDHPAVYIDFDHKVSPWIDEKKLRQQGAIFVWDPTEAHQVSLKEARQRFHQMGHVKIAHFAWIRNKTATPVEMGYAFLPPAS